MKNNEKSRATLLAFIGAYLAYTGIQLIIDVIADKPDNMILFIILGVVFVGVGGYVIFSKGKALLNREYDEVIEDENIENEMTEDDIVDNAEEMEAGITEEIE